MKRDIVCFVCPQGCLLAVQTAEEADDEIRVENNRCLRGMEFAVKELKDPERTLTSTLRVNNGTMPLVSIRSDAPVKKTELKDLITYFDDITINAPVSGGKTLFSAIGKNSVNIIATCSVERKR
jgi:CxxC motif-containing protein